MNTAWSKTTKYVVGVGLALLGIFVLYLARSVIPLLIVAALIAVIARPVILLLHDRLRLPRGVAVAIVYLGLLIVGPLALLLIVPAIVDALRFVVDIDYRGLLQNSVEWLRTTLTSIKAVGLPSGPLDAYVDRTVDAFLAALQGATPTTTPGPAPIATILDSLGSALTATFGAAARLVGAVVSSAVLLIFIFLASIYISLGAHTYVAGFMRLVPDGYRPEIATLLARIGRTWSAFFRGELTLMLVIGVMSWLGLAVLGVPGALSLGIIAGLLELVPNLGPIIAAIPAIVVALLQGSSYLPVSNLTMALLVAGLYILVQQLENNLVVPRVLGGAVDLPALVVMTGVVVGASVAGILGTLLATPVIATAREILRYVYRKMLGQDPFPAEEALTEPVSYSLLTLRQQLRDRFRI